jgi:hypothetical protein
MRAFGSAVILVAPSQETRMPGQKCPGPCPAGPPRNVTEEAEVMDYPLERGTTRCEEEHRRLLVFEQVREGQRARRPPEAAELNMPSALKVRPQEEAERRPLIQASGKLRGTGWHALDDMRNSLSTYHLKPYASTFALGGGLDGPLPNLPQACAGEARARTESQLSAVSSSRIPDSFLEADC